MYIPTKNATVAPAMNTPLSAGQIYCSKKNPAASRLRIVYCQVQSTPDGSLSSA